MRLAREACEVARAFVRQNVAGVILQPLAFLKAPERVTKEIISLFNAAEIPVVLVEMLQSVSFARPSQNEPVAASERFEHLNI